MRSYDDLSNALGTLLRTHRAARGLTQEELAHLSALSVRAIADMERGRTARPYRRSVQRLADALGLSGPERDQFHKAARMPAAPTLSYRQRQRPEDPRNTGAPPQAQVPELPPYLPGQSDEFRLLASLLLAVARAGGSLTVSAVAADGATGPALELRWAGEAAPRGAGQELHIDLARLAAAGGPGLPAEAVRDVLGILVGPPATAVTPSAGDVPTSICD